MKVCKIELEWLPTYYCPLGEEDEFLGSLDDENYTMFVIDMTEEAYLSLPEWEA